ncbi:MAG: hypothetical protein NTY74_02990 [Ignavibacteriae bacterium]|nr:hypothetical protein [Ignavibacteriota bacterium]
MIRNSINKIENDNKKLNQRIDDLIKSTDLQNDTEKKTIDSLKNKISTIENANKKITEENNNLKKDFENEKKFKDRDLENISSKFNKSNIIGIVIAAIIIGVIVFLVLIIIRKFKESNKTVEEKALKIDKELLELMSKQMNIIKESEKSSSEGKSTNESDHSFAMRVADEINRISMRLTKMDDSSRDVQAVRNALKRMESELNQQGYEIIIRNGLPFTDTSTFIPINFIAVEGLKPGEQIIFRTIKPQILYNSQSIQQGEIEVGVNESDLV